MPLPNRGSEARTLRVHAVKQNKRVGNEGSFRGLAGTAAVTAVVKREERTVGECVRQGRQGVRDVLSVSAEIDDGFGSRRGAGTDEHRRVIDMESERRAVCGCRLGRWIVDEGALNQKKGEAERGVNQGSKGKDHKNESWHGDRLGNFSGVGCTV